jgi:ABC-type molybdate transport system substrate-binding protein
VSRAGLAALLLCAGLEAAADDVVVMTSGAFTAPYLDAEPSFERATGLDLVNVFGASTGGALDSIPTRLSRGEPADVIIVSAQALDALIAAGQVERDSRVDLVLSRIGMAVRAGAPKPDIGTVEALVRTLREAESIAYSASVSGTYLSTELFPRLGLAEEMKPKSRRIESERVGAVVARGDAELGFQQISELLPIAGIDYVGPLPDEVQRVSTFSAGIATHSRNPAAARALIEFLASAELEPLIERYGLDRAPRNDEDWQALFNGRDLDGWIPKIRGYPTGVNHGDTFRVVDGLLTVSYDGYDAFDERFGHLFYATPFSHYRLRIEYRFVGEQAAGAPSWALRNSGVMVHAQPPGTMTVAQDFPISLEVQFLGGLRDGKPRPTGNLCSPGTRVVYAGQPDTTHCIASAAATIDGDAWVVAEVLVLGSERVVHIIGGVPVIEYGDVTYGGGNVSGHSPEAKPDGAPLSTGYIALQSESHPIQFRRVELLNLTGCMDPNAVNFRSYYVEPETRNCRY